MTKKKRKNKYTERDEYRRKRRRFLFTATKNKKGRTNKKIPNKSISAFYYGKASISRL